MQDIVLRDLEPYFKSEPATQVDFVPIDDGVTFDSDGRNVVITAWGMAQLSEIDDICYDVTIDGVRQGDRGNGLFMACGKTPHVAFIYCTATPPSAGEHHYGIVQRVRNGTATTNARIHVSEVW
jgi:hypothetical protein